MSVIKNVVLNYVKIKKPAPKFGKEKGCAINDCEFTADVCIPAETAKKLKKKYKTVKSVKNMPVYDEAEYKAAFKVDEAPDAEVYQNADGDYTILKLTAFAGYNDGTPVPEEKTPRVVGTKSLTLAGDGQKVGRSIEVGNGSTGRVSFVERPWAYKDTSGLSLDLTGVQIDTLVPYIPTSSGYENEFEFEEEEEDDFDFDGDDDGDAGDAGKGDTNAPEADNDDPDEW